MSILFQTQSLLTTPQGQGYWLHQDQYVEEKKTLPSILATRWRDKPERMTQSAA